MKNLNWDFIALYYWQEREDGLFSRGVTNKHYAYEVTKCPYIPDDTSEAYWHHHGYHRSAPVVRYIGDE